jgi:hypothetical protein
MLDHQQKAALKSATGDTYRVLPCSVWLPHLVMQQKAIGYLQEPLSSVDQ